MVMIAGCLTVNAQTIHLNSLGFLPDGQKLASVSQECSDFVLVSTAGATVFSGKATGPVHQDDVDQDVWILDFSPVTTPGNYFIDVAGVGKSPEVKIGTDVYDFAYYTSMRAMYLWRCGTAVHGEFNGQVYEHGPCHMEDGYLDYIGGEGRRDGTGGWHDAGDHGKYVVNAGITVGCFFLAWDHFKDRLENVSLDLPDTAPGFPDYLAELKWETDWLLKMPYDDGTGRVSHKLTRLSFSDFIMPDDDHEKRYFTDWSTAATADFSAMLAMAARYFKPYDAGYAATCLDAAKLSYGCLQENPEAHQPDIRKFRTGGYGTFDVDDRLWAAAEMWETTGDAQYLKDFEKMIREYKVPKPRWGNPPPPTGRKVDADWDWDNVRNLGTFTYLLSDKSGKDPELYNQLKSDLLAIADSIANVAETDVYGRTLGGRYYWGCNGTIARQVLNLQIANMIEPKTAYVNASLDAIDHIFGRNVYDRSFVTGLGINPPMHPHDRRSGADNIEAPWPGYIVGGGHNALGWLDEQESFATNEIAINWQAALVYALAGFISPAQ